MTTLAANTVTHADRGLTAVALEAALREVEPAVLLVPPWLLQNIIAHDRGRGGSPFTVPHRDIHVIDRRRLLAIADDEDLMLPGGLPPSPTIILLVRPEADWLEDRPADAALRHYWRLLFHARIDAELHRKLADPSCGRSGIEACIERIGRSAFNEARFVLQREGNLPPNDDLREAYAEFAAVYLELHYFRPDLLAVYFPAIDDGDAVLAALADDIDAASLLRQTRPSGAADSPPLAAEAHEVSLRPRLRGKVVRDAHRAPRLLTRAAVAAARGNVARAAILRMRVFRAAPHDKSTHTAALYDLDVLMNRLAAALQLSGPAAHDWRSALAVVLSHAAGGWWNPEGRLLYDLQKACVDHEREIYSIGVVEWLLEFCRRPLRRPQPNQRLVLMCKALRSALRRVPSARLTTPQRDRLTHLLHDALHHTESRLRGTLRPAIAQSLDAGGVRPRSAAEQVAEQKLIEELLDGLTARGFLTLGNVRDAISRNQIKLDDIPRPRAFFGGDQLLRIDRHLASTLDGVYHRGEAYLRFFQRLSSLLFATHIGRFITRTIIMPFGGSFLVLEAFDHTLFLLIRKLTGMSWLKLSRLEEFKHERLGKFLIDNLPFLVLALILLGALNWPAFRAALLRGLNGFFRALGFLLIDMPRWIAHRPWVEAMARSRPVRLALRYLAKPLIFAGLASLLVPRHVTPRTRLAALAGVFAATNLLLNSRPGRALEQAALHWLRIFWMRVTSDILGNLFRGIMHFFARLLENLDRMLYAVDEWLRFRAGQPKSSLIAKATLGIGWFYISYFTRFAINLLVEPQINPIKHFPVVTVSHKIVLPTVGIFATALEAVGIAKVRARTMAAVIVTSIPGIFGFLAWELKENWKLYRANRPKALRPVQVGSHGESMARLLRPGFHSGTVPKIFARFRRASRLAGEDRASGVGHRASAKAHKQLEALEHVRETVCNFVDRELIALLNQHVGWQQSPVSLGGVQLAVTRINIELLCPAISPAPARIFFEQRAGWIIGGVDQPGWMAQVSPNQAQLLAAALLGLYKIAGVDIVKQQIENLLAPEPIAFELSRDQLTIWPGQQFDAPSVYNLRGQTTSPTATPDGRQLLLSVMPVRWDQWVRIWEPRADGAPAMLPAIRVLPRPCHI